MLRFPPQKRSIAQRPLSGDWHKDAKLATKQSKCYNIVAAFRGMHMSPAKYSYA